MLSFNELQYVRLPANIVPMPDIEYSKNALEKLKKCYELYKEKYKYKEYSIICSNQEEIKFQIPNKNLCHMFGIDFNNIKKPNFEYFRKEILKINIPNYSSFNLLEKILENADKVIEYDNNNENKEKAINYYKCSVKCTIFNRLIDFEKFNFGVINYVGKKENINYNNEKIFFVSSNEVLAPYFMIFMKHDKKIKKFVVSSLYAPVNPIIYFDNQEVIIPIEISISHNDEFKKIVATTEEKMQLLTMYNDILNKYYLENKLNIYCDYESILNDMINKKYSLTR